MFQLLFRPFEVYPNENTATNEIDFSDTKCLVKGLIDVFVHKIYRLPSSYAIKIYKMLVTFLEMHYAKPKVFENYNVIRKMVRTGCLQKFYYFSNDDSVLDFQLLYEDEGRPNVSLGLSH